MRELARCISWTLAFGAIALLIAMFTSVGLAQSEGPLSWLVFVVYSPYYLMSHALGPEAAQARMNAAFMPMVFGVQFLYFFVLVVTVRRLTRHAR